MFSLFLHNSRCTFLHLWTSLYTHTHTCTHTLYNNNNTDTLNTCTWLHYILCDLISIMKRIYIHNTVTPCADTSRCFHFLRVAIESATKLSAINTNPSTTSSTIFHQTSNWSTPIWSSSASPQIVLDKLLHTTWHVPACYGMYLADQFDGMMSQHVSTPSDKHISVLLTLLTDSWLQYTVSSNSFHIKACHACICATVKLYLFCKLLLEL